MSKEVLKTKYSWDEINTKHLDLVLEDRLLMKNPKLCSWENILSLILLMKWNYPRIEIHCRQQIKLLISLWFWCWGYTWRGIHRPQFSCRVISLQTNSMTFPGINIVKDILSIQVRHFKGFWSRIRIWINFVPLDLKVGNIVNFISNEPDNFQGVPSASDPGNSSNKGISFEKRQSFLFWTRQLLTW